MVDRRQASKAFVQAVAKEDLKLEYEAARRVQENLAEVRNKLVKKLRENPDNWNASRLAPVLDVYLKEFERGAVSGLNVGQTLAQGAREGQLIVGEAASIPKNANYWNWAPVIPINAISLLEAESTAKITKVSNQVREQILRKVQQGLASGAPLSDLEKDILGTGLRGSKGRDGIFRSASVRAETIARTTSNELINKGALITYNQVADKLPELGLEKVWQSISDNRTSNVCIALSNQIKPLNQPFESGGWSGMHPPAHPNCRSRVTVLSNKYAKEWDNRFPSSKPTVIDNGLDSLESLFNQALSIPTSIPKSVPKVAEPVRVPALPKNSTHGMPGYMQTDDALKSAIEKLDEEQAQLVARFIKFSKVEFVYLPSGTNESTPNVEQFLGNFIANSKHYNTNKNSKLRWATRSFPEEGASGFTWRVANHVSIKAPLNANLAAINPTKLKGLSSNAIRKSFAAATPNDLNWSLSSSFTKGSPEQVFTTSLHELGHQVKWQALDPTELPSGIGLITQYSGQDKDELFAEHFAAWAINPIEHKKVHPEIHNFITSQLKSFLNNLGY